MFEPLFKKEAEPPPPKGVSTKAWDKILSKGDESCCTKTAAPIALIRKLAAEEGFTKEEREKSLKKEHDRTSKAYLKAKGPGMAIGALGGAVTGGVLGHHHGGLGVPGAYLGAAGGAVLGSALGGGEKGRAAEQRLGEIEQERKSLAAMQPGSRGPLTEENLDRDGYQQARADAAQAKLDFKDSTRPMRMGSLIGSGLGAAAGYVMGPRIALPNDPMPRLGGAVGGVLPGAMLGMVGGTLMAGQRGRKRMNDAANRLQTASEQRNNIWEGASQLANPPAPMEEIRKAAAAIAFAKLTSPHHEPVSTEQIILETKLSSVEDEELFKVAMQLATYQGSDGWGVGLEEALGHYEDLGGKYKAAFGTPMFNVQQMTGSPALAGGMARRASTPMPATPQAQPQQSPATASPRSQAGSVTSMPSAAAQTSAPSAPAASAAAPSVSMG